MWRKKKIARDVTKINKEDGEEDGDDKISKREGIMSFCLHIIKTNDRV